MVTNKAIIILFFILFINLISAENYPTENQSIRKDESYGELLK